MTDECTECGAAPHVACDPSCLHALATFAEDQAPDRQTMLGSMAEALGLLTSMVSCGERHSDESRAAVSKAREALDTLGRGLPKSEAAPIDSARPAKRPADPPASLGEGKSSRGVGSTRPAYVAAPKLTTLRSAKLLRDLLVALRAEEGERGSEALSDRLTLVTHIVTSHTQGF